MALPKDVPVTIPGEPVDVMVAITGAAKSFGIPPEVAVSALAAAKAGEKDAQKKLADAEKLYASASEGDPTAVKQIAGIAKGAKAKKGPEAQAAAFLAAAIGSEKGWSLYKKRKLSRYPTQNAILATVSPGLSAAARRPKWARNMPFLTFGPQIYAPFVRPFTGR